MRSLCVLATFLTVLVACHKAASQEVDPQPASLLESEINELRRPLPLGHVQVIGTSGYGASIPDWTKGQISKDKIPLYLGLQKKGLLVILENGGGSGREFASSDLGKILDG